MENKTMASEIITEQEDRLKAIISELDSTIDDSLEKEKFALAELMDLIDEEPDNISAACAFANNQYRMNMLARIAFDYSCQTKEILAGIVDRECGKQKETLSDE